MIMIPEPVKRNESLVSVVVPVYNGEKYLDNCLESILNQTYKNWECIINNNCSVDNTLNIANKYADLDNRFHVFTNSVFVRMTDNWNLGCSKINKSARYLKVLSADDLLFPESFEKMVDIMEKNPTVGICSSYRLNDKRVDMTGLDIWEGNVYNGKSILYKQLTRKLNISGTNSTVMYAIEHLKKIPRFPVIYDNTTYHEDTELVYDLMNISDVGFVFQVLSYTRRHAKAYTTLEVYRFNTLLQLNEKVLWVYKGDDPMLNKLYRKERIKYAYFLFYKAFTDRDSIKFHKKYILRKFKPSEYVIGILSYNKMSLMIKKILNKVFNLNNS